MLSEECGTFSQQITTVTEGEREVQQAAMSLEIAREGIRKHPALVMEDQVHQPCVSALPGAEEDLPPMPQKQAGRSQTTPNELPPREREGLAEALFPLPFT